MSRDESAASYEEKGGKPCVYQTAITRRCEEKRHTVFAAEDEPVQAIEPEEIEEVPREGRHPAHVHVGGLDAALQHALEAQGERKRELNCGTLNGRWIASCGSQLRQ